MQQGEFRTNEKGLTGRSITQAHRAAADQRGQNIAGLYLPMETRKDWIAGRFHDFFCHQEWNVGIVDEPVHAFRQLGPRHRVSWLPSPGKDRFLADPFGIRTNGRIYILCEQFDYRTNKGVISSIELSDEGDPSPPKVVMEMRSHMSYPYILEHEGRVFCIPETHAAREISLYEADQFPSRWHKVDTLVPNFAGVDPTVFQCGGRWWMFCADADTGADRSLFIWYADDLKGTWRAHPANPVKTGRYGCRPAGTPFVYENQLYRPAMDSSRTYGRRIILNRVTKLSPSEFQEEPVNIVEPFANGPYRDGIHTISALGDVTIVDGLRITFQRAEFERVLEKEREQLLSRFTPLWHKG